MDSLTLNRHNPFQKQNKEKPHTFSLEHLLFKLQQKVLKCNDIYVNWKTKKNDLGVNF